MKFLADMGVARKTVLAIRELGHDVEHIFDTGPHDLPDAKILERARESGRAIITFDLDFDDLLAAIRRFGAELEAGALIVVENARCRLRRLPLK